MVDSRITVLDEFDACKRPVYGRSQMKRTTCFDVPFPGALTDESTSSRATLPSAASRTFSSPISARFSSDSKQSNLPMRRNSFDDHTIISFISDDDSEQASEETDQSQAGVRTVCTTIFGGRFAFHDISSSRILSTPLLLTWRAVELLINCGALFFVFLAALKTPSLMPLPLSYTLLFVSSLRFFVAALYADDPAVDHYSTRIRYK